jgi:hypothetical protein
MNCDRVDTSLRLKAAIQLHDIERLEQASRELDDL